MTDDWISIKQAAVLMHTNEKKLGQRAADGNWLFYPELSRIQPGGKNTKIWFFRSEVDAWIEKVEAAAKAQAISPVTERPQHHVLSQESIEQFKRMGQFKLLKAYGVEG